MDHCENVIHPKEAPLTSTEAAHYQRTQRPMATTRRETKFGDALEASQCIIAVLLIANFLVNLLEAQYNPKMEAGAGGGVYDIFEVLFAVVFTMELTLNMVPVWLFWLF